MKQMDNQQNKKIEGHDDRINCIIQLKDKRLVSCSCDRKIKFWNIETFQCVGTINEKNDYVVCIIQSYDERLVTSLIKCCIKVYDTYSLKCLQTIQTESTINTLIQLFKGEVVSGAMNNFIEVWDTSTDQLVKTEQLAGHSGGVLTLIQLLDTRLASGSQDNNIHIWDMQNFQSIETLKGHKGRVSCLLQLQDCTLASISYDTSIKIWSVKDYQCTATIIEFSTISSVIQLSNGKLCLASLKGKLEIVNHKLFKKESNILNPGHMINKIIQSIDGRIFYNVTNSIYILLV